MNQASVSDPKYDGARVSRKQLQLLEDEDEDVQSENDGDDGELPEGSDSESDIEDDEAEEEDELPSRVTPRMLPPQTKPSKPLKRSKPPQDEQPAPSENQDLASTLRITREQDRKKGKAVSQQLVSRVIIVCACNILNYASRYGTPSWTPEYDSRKPPLPLMTFLW